MLLQKYCRISLIKGMNHRHVFFIIIFPWAAGGTVAWPYFIKLWLDSVRESFSFFFFILAWLLQFGFQASCSSSPLAKQQQLEDVSERQSINLLFKASSSSSSSSGAVSVSGLSKSLDERDLRGAPIKLCSFATMRDFILQMRHKATLNCSRRIR